MKNLSLFVTLGLISLMGAFAPVNAEPGEEINPDTTVELSDSPSIDEDGNVIMEEPGVLVEEDNAEIPTGDESAEASEAGTTSEDTAQ